MHKVSWEVLQGEDWSEECLYFRGYDDAHRHFTLLEEAFKLLKMEAREWNLNISEVNIIE